MGRLDCNGPPKWTHHPAAAPGQHTRLPSPIGLGGIRVYAPQGTIRSAFGENVGGFPVAMPTPSAWCPRATVRWEGFDVGD